MSKQRVPPKRAELDEGIATMRKMVATIVDIVRQEPTQENVFTGLVDNIDYALKQMRQVRDPRIGKAMSSLFVVKCLVNGIRKNPMWDSPALALQIEAAAQELLARVVASVNEDYGDD